MGAVKRVSVELYSGEPSGRKWKKTKTILVTERLADELKRCPQAIGYSGHDGVWDSLDIDEDIFTMRRVTVGPAKPKEAK